VSEITVCAFREVADVLDPTQSEWELDMVQIASHLEDHQMNVPLEVLRPRSEILSGDLGHNAAVQHHIPTHGSPIAPQPYRAVPQSRSLIDDVLWRMRELDVIEPASGRWSSAAVLISIPDGSIRFCMDYRSLNTVTENDYYVLPRIDDCVESLGGSKYFTNLNVNCGYWQIDVAPGDRD
jgi:hypothetical protein